MSKEAANMPTPARLAAAAALAALAACAPQPDTDHQTTARTPPMGDDRGGGPMERSVTEEVLLDGAPSADEDAAEPSDHQPAAEADPEPEAEARAEPDTRSDRPAWWLDEPTTGEAGFAATVQADGASVSEARAAAVDRALATVADHGSARAGARIEKTLIRALEPGRYRAFVYVACPADATAQAGDGR